MIGNLPVLDANVLATVRGGEGGAESENKGWLGEPFNWAAWAGVASGLVFFRLKARLGKLPAPPARVR